MLKFRMFVALCGLSFSTAMVSLADMVSSQRISQSLGISKESSRPALPLIFPATLYGSLMAGCLGVRFEIKPHGYADAEEALKGNAGNTLNPKGMNENLRHGKIVFLLPSHRQEVLAEVQKEYEAASKEDADLKLK